MEKICNIICDQLKILAENLFIEFVWGFIPGNSNIGRYGQGPGESQILELFWSLNGVIWLIS